jgi:putative polyhydroxyalkanoate system protein
MSKPITVSIPHQLGREEARRRIEQGFASLGEQLGGGLAQVHKSWSGDRMQFAARVMGQGISGNLDVLDDSVRMEVELPPLLSLAAGRIKGRLQKEGQLLLESRKS